MEQNQQPAPERQTYGSTAWSPEDVIEAFKQRGKRISAAKAEEWLHDNEDTIREAMIAAGWAAIDALI